jgi:hypothetical protein
MDRTLDLIAPLGRGRRVIGKDFDTLQLENAGRCIDALPIALAPVEIDDDLHDVPPSELLSAKERNDTVPFCLNREAWD